MHMGIDRKTRPSPCLLESSPWALPGSCDVLEFACFVGAGWHELWLDVAFSIISRKLHQTTAQTRVVGAFGEHQNHSHAPLGLENTRMASNSHLSKTYSCMESRRAEPLGIVFSHPRASECRRTWSFSCSPIKKDY